MTKWLCTCGYIYDETRGLPSLGFPPNVPFLSLPSYSCPRCKKGRDHYEEIKRQVSHEGVPVIVAHYDRLNQWVMDPQGYFTIKIFDQEKMIRVRYYNASGTLQCLIEGKYAIEIYNTIVREGFISTLQHAADVGAELMKAEVCMNAGFAYVQDGPINYKRDRFTSDT